MFKQCVLLVVFSCGACWGSAASKETFWLVENVASGFGVPWGMAFVSESEVLVTERSGSLKLLDVNTGAVQLVTGAPKVLAKGQGGLLDVAVPPGFTQGAWIYFTYSKPIQGSAATTLARARLTGSQLVELEDLLVTDSVTDTQSHFGSRIAFKMDVKKPEKSTIFFSVGDRGERGNGQDLTNHAGTVIRLYFDGTIPSDNPFIGNKKVLPEIWSYGHRNPQGLAYDETTDRLWLIEHGPRGGDEINLIKKGANYGWPVVSHGKEYWGPFSIGEGDNKPGMEPAIKVYVPSIAPGSLLFYSGNGFPRWKGNLMAGALKLTHINRVVLNARGNAVDEERILSGMNERVRSLIQSPEGWIYFATDSGAIHRIVPISLKQ